MSRLRVHNVTVSIDGFMAGPDQTLTTPMGVGAQKLHAWAFATPTYRRMFGEAGVADEDTIDARLAEAGDQNIGATIMGRNMFGPIRGQWGPDENGDEWTGWWGPEPPYHHPVFVLTHYPKEPLVMGETTFHFVTTGIEDALKQAQEAAGEKDIRLGGGADAIRQYLAAQLIDELHLAYAPIRLGDGERVFDENQPLPTGYEVIELVSGAGALHVKLARK